MKFSASKFRMLIAEKDIKIDDLAEQLHLSRQTISNWYHGHGQPNIDNLFEICAVLGCEATQLIMEDKKDGKEKSSDQKASKKRIKKAS